MGCGEDDHMQRRQGGYREVQNGLLRFDVVWWLEVAMLGIGVANALVWMIYARFVCENRSNAYV